MTATLFKFNENNQDTNIIKCDLGKAHDLFIDEVILAEKGDSLYTYFDITVKGKLLRSYKSRRSFFGS